MRVNLLDMKSGSLQLLPEAIRKLQQAIQLADADEQCNPIIRVVLRQWLGGALPENPEGNEEENIELAISTTEEAIDILNSLPTTSSGKEQSRRAFIALNLANNLVQAYQHRLSGVQERNIERSIAFCR